MSYKTKTTQWIDPINDQIDDLKQTETMIDNLGALSKKYNLYRDNSSRQISDREKNIRHDSRYGKYDEIDNRHVDPYEELIMTKNIEIDDLKNEILVLKQKFVDISLLYNSKIECLRQDHRKELHSQHKKFMERLKTYEAEE
jgi:hypothetical protein